jgi:glyoxylase-like metal-dependent hydrolase (beta-lactamase superfamily II)
MQKTLANTLRAALLGVAALAAMAAGAQAQVTSPPQRALVPVAGDLYRFQNAFHTAAVYVTPDGIIVVDSINADASRWLKQELATRFPGRAVKYLVYSHDHADHISGGEVFANTATVVAHRNAKERIVGEKRPTAVPNLTFSDSMTIELGGKVVNLRHVGRNHSDNSIVAHFPAERAIFAVDFIPVKSFPFRDLPDSYFPDWIDSLRAVETMDFDILVPGHGPNGGKADVTIMREYLTELHGEVLMQVRAGKTRDEVKQLVKMEKYKAWPGYEQSVPLNVEGMYTYVSLNRRGN